MANNRKPDLELRSGIVTIVLSLAALLLFCLSYTTKYYIFGQLQSSLILLLLLGGIVAAGAALVLRRKMPDALWPKLLSFCVTALLAASAILLLGDRVEGIGTCILTDYDSGHGGEEAIYMSLGAVILLLLAVIFNVIGSFDKEQGGAGKGGKIATYAIAGVLCLAVLLTSLSMGGVLGSRGGPAAVGGGKSAVYTVSFNANNENLDRVPGYQFLCSDFSGFLSYDSRFYVDVTLTLDGSGSYTLFSDAYTVEGGKRTEIGDDTGLGMITTTTAEGSYVDNGDGTVTISGADHAVFVMEMDTYSSQMKEAAGMGVGEHSEDGTYDSAEYPEVLEFVPASTFTLSGDEIVTWRDANAGGVYTVSFNSNNENLDRVPGYQFLCSDFSGFLSYDSRFYVDVTLTLDGSGGYTLFSDAYTVEGGKRTEIGDDTGLGMITTTTAEGSYVENEDGSITTHAADHAVFVMEMDTYSSQMKEAAGMGVGEHSEDGTYDSAEYPEVLEFVPETVWTLDNSGKAIVTWLDAGAQAEEAEPEQPAESAEKTALSVVQSEDGATSFTFYRDGTYKFYFEAYDISDEGSYRFDGENLTITDANGKETVASGDPLTFVYTFSQNEQLTGSFSVPASELTAPAAEEEAVEGAEIESDDGGTRIVFYPTGSYQFFFDAYGISDAGSYSYVDGVLTLTDENGRESTADGDPMHLHYTYSQNDALTGDYTIPAEALAFQASSAEEAEGVEILSDDGGTAITFFADGSYRFWFESYSIEDLGTYTYEDGVLTLTDANGLTYSAEGDPMHLHYGYSGAPDQLTGEYTIPAAALSSPPDGAASADEVHGLTIVSDDHGTSITLNSNGSYRFWFEAYSIEDLGTWQIADGVLTLTDANGKESSAKANPYKLHYEYSQSSQLTGDYTVSADIFPFPVSGFSVPSEDAATTMSFFDDGSYTFAFGNYSIVDIGSYSFADGVLTLTDANGKETVVKGETLALHYEYSQSNQLTGDFSIDPAFFG